MREEPKGREALLEDLQVSIPRTIRILDKKPYTTYEVIVETGSFSWAVQRRYSRFLNLHNALKSLFPGLHLPKFPSKTFGSALKKKLIMQRQQDLQSYLQQIILSKAFRTCDLVDQFLEIRSSLKRLVAVAQQQAADAMSIHQAVEHYKVELVEDMCKRDFRLVNTIDDSTGGTPLHIALQKGFDDIASFLLDQNSSVNIKDQQGWTALHTACFHVNEAMINRILSCKGVDTEALTNRSESALILYASRSQSSTAAGVVKALLGAGVPLDTQSESGETALHHACFAGNIGSVRALLEAKASVDLLNEDLESPLHWAARGGKQAIVSLLIQKGANVNLKGKFGTPLEIVYQKRAERSSMKVESSQLREGAGAAGEPGGDPSAPWRHTMKF